MLTVHCSQAERKKEKKRKEDGDGRRNHIYLEVDSRLKSAGLAAGSKPQINR